MQAPTSIEKFRINDPLQRFNQLRKEAIELLQELSGNTWTDYNLHDPGITILEQLCYALTELEYKAGFDVADLLTDELSGKIDFKKLGLYKPYEIFPSRAVTEKDFRKLIYDSVPEIYNAWVIPHTELPVKGLYTIIAGIDGANQMSHDDKERYRQQIRTVFCRNRNMGEDLANVQILETEEVKVFAEVDISGQEPPEDIMAQILFRLSCYMQEEIKYYSFHELKEQGMSLEEMYTGPLLQNGFVLDQSLQPKHTRIEIKRIFQNLATIEGIASIPLIYFEYKGQRHPNSITFNDPGKGPQLFIPRTDKEQTIRLTKNGRVLHVNTSEARSKFFLLKAQYRNPYRHKLDHEQLVPSVKGSFKKVADYYSIQHQFPDAYGINSRGLGASMIISDSDKAKTTEREAQAKQLKAYLMIFEQVMANYLAQLGSIKDLFAKDADMGKSYYSQTLASVPNADGLYVGMQKKVEDSIAELLLKQDNSLDRRNRMLDYLLALYGESFSQNALSQFNYYYRPDELAQEKLRNKIRFLNRLPKLNKNKAKAFCYLDQAWNTSNISGLEERASILLGITYTEDKSCINIFGQRGLELITENGTDGTKCATCSLFHHERDISNQLYVEQNFHYVGFDNEAIDSERYSNEWLYKHISPLSNGKLSEHFLRSGVDSQSYKIGNTPGSRKYTLAHYFRKTERWKEIGMFDSYDDAAQAAKMVRTLLVELNKNSEGMHLIEHVLLRPEDGSQMYKTRLRLPMSDDIFSGYTSFQPAEDSNIDTIMLDSLSDSNNYGIYHYENKGCKIWVDIDNVGRLECEQWDTKHKDATIAIELISWFFTNLRDRNASLTEYLDMECFFSFGVSVLMPSWTSRFHNKHFKTLFEDTVRFCAPAHLSLRFYWLTPAQITDFETMYVNWLEERQSKRKDNAILHRLTEQIVLFLQKTPHS